LELVQDQQRKLKHLNQQQLLHFINLMLENILDKKILLH